MIALFLFFKLSLAREDRRNRTKLYNPRSIEEFQIIFPRLDWLEYFNTFLTQKDQITGDEVIILSDEATFVMLHKLLESTPKRYLTRTNMQAPMYKAFFCRSQNNRELFNVARDPVIG